MKKFKHIITVFVLIAGIINCLAQQEIAYASINIRLTPVQSLIIDAKSTDGNNNGMQTIHIKNNGGSKISSVQEDHIKVSSSGGYTVSIYAEIPLNNTFLNDERMGIESGSIIMLSEESEIIYDSQYGSSRTLDVSFINIQNRTITPKNASNKLAYQSVIIYEITPK